MRTDLGDRLEIGDGALKVVFLIISDAAVMDRIGVLAVDFDCLTEVGDGAVDIALVETGVAAVLVGGRMRGGEFV
jgi:hypothetical protein